MPSEGKGRVCAAAARFRLHALPGPGWGRAYGGRGERRRGRTQSQRGRAKGGRGERRRGRANGAERAPEGADLGRAGPGVRPALAEVVEEGGGESARSGG